MLKPWHHPHERSYKMPPFNLWVGTSMHDGVPFLISNRISGREFIVCLHPRAANSVFKFLFRAASSWRRPHDATLPSLLFESPHSRQTARTPDMQRAFMKSHVPRIMIVRNPYLRLLSSYLSEMQHHKATNGVTKDYDYGESFENFVEKLVKHQADPEKIDFQDPYKLQSKNCLQSDGMTYDYYLPVEQMDFWYESLMDSLDLIPFTREWWNSTGTHHYQGKPNQPCFYRAFNRTCEEMFSPVDYTVDGSSSSIKPERLLRNRKPRNRRSLRGEETVGKSASSQTKQATTIEETIDSLQQLVNSLQERLRELKLSTNGGVAPPEQSSASSSSSTSSSAAQGVTADPGPPSLFDMERLVPREEFHSYLNQSNLHLTNYYRLYYRSTLAILKNYFSKANYHYESLGAIEKFQEFYNSDGLIEKVTEWMMPDLQEYHYPVWTPNNMTYQDYLFSLYMEMPKAGFKE
jgi:hypothetical protein